MMEIEAQMPALDTIAKETTVIVIDDGRIYRSKSEEGIFEALRDRCRRLHWHNRKDEGLWDCGDSDIRSHVRLCSEMRPCRNHSRWGGIHPGAASGNGCDETAGGR